MKLHWRKIVVDGVTWKWRTGRSNVVARSSTEKRVIDFSTLTGASWDDIQSGIYRYHFYILPSEVAAWLSE